MWTARSLTNRTLIGCADVLPQIHTFSSCLRIPRMQCIWKKQVSLLTTSKAVPCCIHKPSMNWSLDKTERTALRCFRYDTQRRYLSTDTGHLSLEKKNKLKYGQNYDGPLQKPDSCEHAGDIKETGGPGEGWWREKSQSGRRHAGEVSHSRDGLVVTDKETGESQPLGVPIPLQSLPADLKHCNIEDLYTSLKQFSADELLTLVGRSHRSMDALCVALCMKNLYRRYLTSDKQETFRKQLTQHLSFQVLVASLCAKAPHYDPHVLFDSVRFFSDLGFTSQDFPLRVFLQLIKFGIGDLELNRLIHLSGLVMPMPETRETVLLMEGIKCLMNGRIDEISTLSIDEQVLLVDMFTETLHKDFTEELLAHLLDNLHEFQAVHIPMVLSALARISYRCLHKKDLLFECVSLVNYEFDSLSNDEVFEVLESVETFKQKIPEDYQGLLLRIAGRLKIQEDVQLGMKLDVLNKLWIESLLEVDFLRSVISQINSQGQTSLTLDLTEEEVSSLLQCIVETPEEFEMVGGGDAAMLTGWLGNYRHLLSQTGLDCLKRILSTTAPDGDTWLVDEKRNIAGKSTGRLLTKLDEERTVYIDGLSLHTDKKDVTEFFRTHANVTGVELLPGAAFVEFEHLSDSVQEMTGKTLLDSVIEIQRLEDVKRLPPAYEYVFVSEEDYKHKHRKDWPTVTWLSGRVEERVRERAVSAGYTVLEEISKVSPGTQGPDLTLTHSGNPGNKVSVVIVKPGQYFHNTGHLKRSQAALVRELEDCGHKVVVIFLKEVSKMSEEELCVWVQEKLTSLDGN